MSDSDNPALTKAVANSASQAASLQTFKMLDALRNGDEATLLPLLKTYKTTQEHVSTPLHVAVRCAKFNTVQLVLKELPATLNIVDSHGQTPLHIAASLGRAEVVGLFLSQPGIDDSIKDDEGRTAMEVSMGPEVATQISVSRAKYGDTYNTLLAEYITSGTADLTTTSAADVPRDSQYSHVSAASGHVSNIQAERLYHFLSRPRAKLIDFSTQESTSGTTLLHEASRRNDLGLIKMAISKGADILALDKAGRLPVDVSKDERIKAALRRLSDTATTKLKSAALTNTSEHPDVKDAPVMRGYLQKWTNMARGYRVRWFVLSNGILSYYRSQEEEGKASKGSISMSVAKVVPPGSDKLKFEVASRMGKNYPGFYLKGSHPVEVLRWVEALKQSVEWASEKNLSRTSTRVSVHSLNVAPSFTEAPTHADHSSVLNDDDDDTFSGDGSQTMPHEEDIQLLKSNLKTQGDLTAQLFDDYTSAPQEETKQALRSSLASLSAQITEILNVFSDRERYLIKKCEHENDIRRLWEENMKELVAQQAQMESDLEKMGRDNNRKRRALKEVKATLSPDGNFASEGDNTELSVDKLTLGESTATGAAAGAAGALFTAGAAGSRRKRSTTLSQIVDNAIENDNASDSDSDDEFFEAIESGSIDAAPVHVPEPALPEIKALTDMDQKPYIAYKEKRTQLPIQDDERPAVSLWAILKSSIGKDLTKISFPVYFNEPTSMLQRMAEDIEFTECLDCAAAYQDPLKRIMYVAAFAMSNYSSTIGRIAKPFNPMLGETYEYVDVDKKYRYISEQVSHHPPISACIAESPSWEYFGEVDAKNKFMGKSFEIKPTGVAHVRLNLPKEWAPSYPPARRPNIVVEHYSWRKVTTVVTNFLFGKPIIDHYGDLVVTNHRTGDKCILTFKPRGWRGAGACEIKGKVVTPDGKEHWDIAGKWSSQLVARRVGTGVGDLQPDAALPSESARTGDESKEYICLWKNSPKPPGMPFNLTPFAINLNNINDDLKPWLPQTDCRLRPDQHAFEAGLYDKANTLKTQLEDYQRETRRRRELGELPPHKPRWFERKIDEDTGERYWKASYLSDNSLEYWKEREKVGYAKIKGDKNVTWKGVEKIFGGYEE